jgi:hypothetical protein
MQAKAQSFAGAEKPFAKADPLLQFAHRRLPRENLARVRSG